MSREELKRRSVWGGFQILFLNQQIIYKITRFSVLVVLIFYFPQTAFAQAPVLSAIEASALNYNEGQIPTPITNSITVTDADSPLLSNATIKISNNFSGTEDLLQFIDDFSITGSYDQSTGTLTLTGPATLAEFTSALRSVTYQNTNNNNPSGLVRTISFSVNDGSSNSLTVVRDIQVNPINDPPTGQPDNFVIYEDTDLDCGCLLLNDTDPEGEDLIALHADPPLHGTVTDLGGFYIYTPYPDFYGTDSFTYYANDGSQNSAPILVTITVLPVNDAPIAANDAVTTNEDTPLGISILSNDTDVDDVLDATMIVLITSPTQGTLTINAATSAVVYSPNLNYNGNDSFTYQVKDAAGALSNTATVAIVIQPVNDVPIANADFATTPEETPVSIPVLANDSDVDNSLDPASLLVITSPLNGQAVVQPATGMIEYVPQENFTGVDSFTYTVSDAQGAISLPVLVTITVAPVNDVPVAVNDEASTNENTPVDIDIISNDIDVDNDVTPGSIVITTNPVHGTVVLNPVTGSVTYTPDPDFTGNDSFTYTLQDPSGSTSPPATVTVNIIPAPNLAPDAVDDGPIMNTALSPITIDVLANDHDEDDDELILVSVTNPFMGTVKIVDDKIVYQPTGLTSGTVTFTYTIQDPSGLSDEAVVTIENSYPPLIVSEGFSPNGNHNNETWFIQGIENYPNNSVKVFDRWGFLVYQKQHYENFTTPWDGRGNMAQQSGKLLDQGTYYYILDPGSEMKTMTGYVVIIR
jgi:gliding motility-associated-like protein